jgi:hypothetical protein
MVYKIASIRKEKCGHLKSFQPLGGEKVNCFQQLLNEFRHPTSTEKNNLIAVLVKFDGP